jgi:hypothetical protein
MRKIKRRGNRLSFFIGVPVGCLFSGLQGNNRDNLLILLGAAEIHGAGNGCKNRVILADADAGSGVPGGAALADDNVAGNDVFAAKALHAKPPARGIAAVAG